MADADHFPRIQALTQGFSLGRPRSASVGNGRVAFLRSRGGTDPVTCLWIWTETEGERLIVDPLTLADSAAELPAAERARRERTRERASGITTYALDSDFTTATFTLAGALGRADLISGEARLLPAAGPVADARPSPDARHLAYLLGSDLVIASADGTVRATVSGPGNTTCGAAEFIATEEMARSRGYWWSPDSQRIVATIVDDAPIAQWWISDPSQPWMEPTPQRYPAAGTANAIVSLVLLDLDGASVPVTGWDNLAFPYLTSCAWTTGGLAITVQSRDHRSRAIMRVDPATGEAATVRLDHDDTWFGLVTGLPLFLPDGRLLHTLEDTTTDTRRLAVEGTAISPPHLHLAGYAGSGDDGVLIAGTTGDPSRRELFLVRLDGSEATPVGAEHGMASGLTDGDLTVLTTAGVHAPTRVTIHRGETTLTTLDSVADAPPLTPVVRMVRGGSRDLQVVIVLPTGHQPGRKLPVLMNPYGGPGAAVALASTGAWLTPQWLADQGFAVVVADGRGAPGRSLSWEKAIWGDLATHALADQVQALEIAAAAEPDLDLTRVAIRGWSFGGYLAALAVLRRPDVFHAAVAGAPVIDWALYDTFYTEQYLGTDTGADSYTTSSLSADAGNLRRPLLLVHGLADDNVVAAHTLQFSARLLAHGKPHDVLPLSGVTHVAGAPEVAENLLRLQVEWLHRALQ